MNNTYSAVGGGWSYGRGYEREDVPELIRLRFTHFFCRALCLRPNGACHLSDGYGFLWCFFFFFGSFLVVMTERGGGNRRTRGKRGKERGVKLQRGASRHVRSRYRFCKLHLTAQSTECSLKEQMIGFFSHVEIHFILTRFFWILTLKSE